MEYQNVIFEKSDGVATIRINRPHAFNALSFALADELVNALERCDRDGDIRAVILTGVGKAFCSGGDLAAAKGYLDTDPADLFRQLTKSFNRIIMDLRLLPKPVIAAINGSVGGGGFSITTACDIRIMASSAIMRQAYTSVGLVPDGGFTVTVPLLIGLGKAMELVLLDPVIDAQKALELGLVTQVVEDAELEQASREMALRLAKGPTKAFGLAKDFYNQSMLPALEQQLERERTGLIKAANTLDYREGLTAFFEKRKPNYIGK